jgi:hypothetical protein
VALQVPYRVVACCPTGSIALLGGVYSLRAGSRVRLSRATSYAGAEKPRTLSSCSCCIKLFLTNQKKMAILSRQKRRATSPLQIYCRLNTLYRDLVLQWRKQKCELLVFPNFLVFWCAGLVCASVPASSLVI